MPWGDCQWAIVAKCDFEHKAIIKASIIATSTVAFALRDINMLFMGLYQIEYLMWTGVNTFLTAGTSIRIPDNNMLMP